LPFEFDGKAEPNGELPQVGESIGSLPKRGLRTPHANG
jgi:hypothetical protein